MKKIKLRKIGFNWFENLNFNKCLNATAYLVFALVFVVMLKTIINQFIPAKPSPPVDYGNLLVSYSGIPFAFWLFLSIGLMFGLAFHGFKLFSINIEKRECDLKHFKNKNNPIREHSKNKILKNKH